MYIYEWNYIESEIYKRKIEFKLIANNQQLPARLEVAYIMAKHFCRTGDEPRRSLNENDNDNLFIWNTETEQTELNQTKVAKESTKQWIFNDAHWIG